MTEFKKFMGNCPKNVSKDAKYAIRHQQANEYVVALTYRTTDDEQWLATSQDHPALVEMVNAIKIAKNGKPGGPFYINEFGQVIVPVNDTDHYYLAGEYRETLTFDFEDVTLSPMPQTLDGRELTPGDTWEGPHVGIPYVLKAGAQDIAYKTSPRPNVEKTHRLSKIIGPIAALEMCELIRGAKGFAGGRFYVNELGVVFAPVGHGSAVAPEYVYIGKIDPNLWFPPID